ncbi:hypothetical protein I79_018646 [Cricetulus griseus]|uniref:Uncharacterized protein n=1 Tax=Cricetulus griseus TaxID=10029 RepID=G3I5A3_CRIGR|nr:hypothetical protein I79_018646 [Cricetulus griseus]
MPTHRKWWLEDQKLTVIVRYETVSVNRIQFLGIFTFSAQDKATLTLAGRKQN